MGNPKYSIIVPHYEDYKGLTRLLNSVPPRKDIEVVVVDDCSSDLNLLKSIIDQFSSNIKLLSTSKNAGAGAARNIGIDAATAQYLIFADSDDFFLEEAFCIFDKNQNEENDLTYYLSDSVNIGNYKPSQRHQPFNNLCNDYVRTMSRESETRLKVGHVVPWSKVYSRSHIEFNQIRFEEIKYSNDVMFNVLAALKAQKFSVVQDIVYVNVDRTGSITKKKGVKQFKIRLGCAIRTANVIQHLGYKHQLSSNYWIMTSLRYGLNIFLDTLVKCSRSNLKFSYGKLFSDIGKYALKYAKLS